MKNMKMRFKVRPAWILGAAAMAAAVVLVAPRKTNAIPAFARKYNVSCFTCHTIFPHLNKLGYTFRRLGYRMPPDWEGTKPPQKISSLDENIPFKLTNAMATFVRSNVTWDTAPNDQGKNKTTSSINLAEASLFAGGSVPHSNLSYFGEYVMYEDGGSDLERFKVDWTGGNVENSYFVGIGKAHLQTGYAAASSMGLTDDDSPLAFTTVSPNGFSFDQSTGMVEGGYTYMAPNYKYIVGLTVKVTNGVDASGEGITSGSQYNHKDLWFGGDFLFGENGSVSVMYYNGRKPQVQNDGTPDSFLYQPKATRWGLFGHYMFFDHLDMLAGYEGGREDWKGLSTDPTNTFNSHAYFGEADYYIHQGLVVYARYDRTHFDQPEPGLAATNGRLWMAGIMQTITQKGNAKVFAQYTDNRQSDLTGVSTDEKEALLGFDFGW